MQHQSIHIKTLFRAGTVGVFYGNGKPENNQYFYHSDHLGSTSYITDRQGNAEQFIVYMPYGEVLTEEHGNWDSPYRFNGKEQDAETGLYYYGARYYEPNVGMWYGVDKLTEKYPNVGGYVYCHNNPINRIDADGNGDYYNSTRNFIYSDGNNDGRIYVISSNQTYNMDKGKLNLEAQNWSTTYVGQVTATRTSFTGDANETNVAMSEGKFQVIQTGSNNQEYTRVSLDANSGPFGNGSLENGDYTLDNVRTRTEAGYTRDGVGFSIDINPTFSTDRSLLRVHPDGNTRGTLGCIGLEANAAQLNDVRQVIQNATANSSSIDLNVNINANPNNSGGNQRVIPTINE